MKKNLLLCLFICLSFQSYSQSNNWMISSDATPLSRSGNERVLNNPSGLNLEWRNRVGFKLGEQTMMGLSTSYRHYDLKEITYLFPDAKVGGRQYQTNNNLFGIGAFLTQYYHITPRFHLQTTAYLQVDQGKGTYKHYLLRSSDTIGIGEGVLLPTQLVEMSTFRERNFFAGLEFGASYFLTPKWVLQTNINVLQYENFRNTLADQSNLPYGISRPVEQDGSGVSFLTDRTIINLGVMVFLGKR